MLGTCRQKDHCHRSFSSRKSRGVFSSLSGLTLQQSRWWTSYRRRGEAWVSLKLRDIGKCRTWTVWGTIGTADCSKRASELESIPHALASHSHRSHIVGMKRRRQRNLPISQKKRKTRSQLRGLVGQHIIVLKIRKLHPQSRLKLLLNRSSSNK